MIAWHELFNKLTFLEAIIVMEIYSEVIRTGNLNVEISVRKKINQDTNACWAYCTARNREERIVWQGALTGDDGHLLSFAHVEDALNVARQKYCTGNDEDELHGLANKEVDKTLYFLSLL